MSITEELREFASHCAGGMGGDSLQHIADRIDAEHERLMQEQPFTVDMVPMTDERMAEHGWVRLPVDADGVPIRVGDVMEVSNGRRDEVRFLTLNENGWAFNEKGWVPNWSHHHKPTVEDVLTEFGIDWEHESDCEDRAALLKEYAAKLRLAGDAE